MFNNCSLPVIHWSWICSPSVYCFVYWLRQQVRSVNTLCRNTGSINYNKMNSVLSLMVRPEATNQRFHQVSVTWDRPKSHRVQRTWRPGVKQEVTYNLSPVFKGLCCWAVNRVKSSVNLCEMMMSLFRFCIRRWPDWRRICLEFKRYDHFTLCLMLVLA